MKDFDIAKYLREHRLGSYSILNIGSLKQSALTESEFGFGEFPKPKKEIWLQLMDRGVKDGVLSEKDYSDKDIVNAAKKLAAEFEKMEEPNRQSNKKLFLSMFYDAVKNIKSR